MGLKDFLTSQSIEKGLTAKYDRQNKFKLRRVLDKDGFHTFVLENIFKKERIYIKKFIFDRFRGQISQILLLWNDKEIKSDDVFEIKYKTKTLYEIKIYEQSLIIKLIDSQEHESRVLTCDLEALNILHHLLYSEDLKHPNEVLDRIVTYHKLFQFTFESGSESITSDLSLKKNVLSSIERYVPQMKRSHGLSSDDLIVDMNGDGGGFNDGKSPSELSDDKEPGSFQSRLGERSGDQSYKVDFEKLFDHGLSRSRIDLENSKPQKKNSESNHFQIPLLSSDIKIFRHVPFKCEFSKQEIEDFRDVFLTSRNQETFIGFEMMEAIYKTESGRLSCFRFPLYYLRVKISESGRNIILTPVEQSRVYLNHLAIANLIEKFSKSKLGSDGLDAFFKNLLAQGVEVEGEMSRVYIARNLPCSDDVFQKTREVLLGYPGENGMGGLLGKLKLIGIECDLESVYLYKTTKVGSPVTASLEHDLDNIVSIATHKPKQFGQSLLGDFLAPGVSLKRENTPFCRTPWIPGSLPKSTKRLIDKLNGHDLLLLEGPPGTGKTFTIMNLFIHCICTNKRLLVVSDQKGAIHALTEKIQEYLMGKDRASAEAKATEALWRSAIKVVDEIPDTQDKLSKWIQDLKDMLGADSPLDVAHLESRSDYEGQMRTLDKEIRALKRAIEAKMHKHIGDQAKFEDRVTSKIMHATTQREISELVDFLSFLNKLTKHGSVKQVMRRFIEYREQLLLLGYKDLYQNFSFPHKVQKEDVDKIILVEAYIDTLIKVRAKTFKSFHQVHSKIYPNEIASFVEKKWKKAFPTQAGFVKKSWCYVKALFSYPLKNDLAHLQRFIKNQRKFLSLAQDLNEGVLNQIKLVHRSLNTPLDQEVPLSLEICRFVTKDNHERNEGKYSVQEYLERIDYLYKKRDRLIKKQFINNIGVIAKSVMLKDEKENTSLITTISSTLDALKNHDTIESGAAFLADLKQSLFDAFPVWVCRKQAVPFLFPCHEQSFDLVIVDEATQCGVDESLPLLFRAKKLIVVGDEKQTVLAKNSVIDDYLFHEFNLEEHLRNTQARGFKGGGSQIFSLVKGIKQAHVMLDEHYRCPPDIIQYSNHYVYHDELKTMQWVPNGQARSVVVDYSEKKSRDTGKQTSGQFKGLEIKMIDRFLEYVAKTIKDIEKSEGKRINVETDVALCYFLLKNEPYIKRVKGEFLTKLNRGNDILDGAGAALQGKERDYIFYFWDISRSNMMSFRQGDDPDKRKGELNVLMSRPKVRAYHYLHKNFDDLNHGSASITDFLWKAYHNQSSRVKSVDFKERSARPEKGFVPWRRSSGQMMLEILQEMLENSGNLNHNFSKQFSVQVGDATHCVDLMISPAKSQQSASVGLVDLSSFSGTHLNAEEIVDYYFQLQRATPKVKPIFLFMHELACEDSRAYKRLQRAVEQNVLLDAKGAKKVS